MEHKIFKLSIILLCLAICLIVYNGYALAKRFFPTNNLGYPVLIKVEDKPIGGGFFYVDDKNIYFVTARHILFEEVDQKKKEWALTLNTISLIQYRPDIDDTYKNELLVDLKGLYNEGRVRYHKLHDVAVVYIAKVKKTKEVKQLFFSNKINPIIGSKLLTCHKSGIKEFKNVLIGNDVILFGYPLSIIEETPQLEKDKPLLRKGIVAGKNRAKETIIIDCPIYYGNSGSPVMEIERVAPDERTIQTPYDVTFLIVGVTTQFVPYKEDWRNLSTGQINPQIVNSGYAIVEPMDSVLELLLITPQ